MEASSVYSWSVKPTIRGCSTCVLLLLLPATVCENTTLYLERGSERPNPAPTTAQRRSPRAIPRRAEGHGLAASVHVQRPAHPSACSKRLRALGQDSTGYNGLHGIYNKNTYIYIVYINILAVPVYTIPLRPPSRLVIQSTPKPIQLLQLFYGP